MSVQAMAAVFKHSASRGNTRLVLLGLADVANDQGEVSAYRRSYSALAAKANCGVSTVTKAVKELVEELGEVERTEDGGGRRSASYVIRLPTLGAGPAQVEHAQVEHPGVSSGAGRVPGSSTLPAQSEHPIIPSLFHPSPSSSGPRRSKHPLPDDFTLTATMRVWAHDNTPSLDVDHETAQFVDHWRSKGEARVDWNAAWRTWCRNAVKFARPKGKARPVDDRRGGTTSEVQL